LPQIPFSQANQNVKRAEVALLEVEVKKADTTKTKQFFSYSSPRISPLKLRGGWGSYCFVRRKQQLQFAFCYLLA